MENMKEQPKHLYIVARLNHSIAGPTNITEPRHNFTTTKLYCITVEPTYRN
jgi:hypothetical protein